MFKLAHLSDLHVCLIDKMSLAALFSRRIAGYMNWKLNRSSLLQLSVLDAMMKDILACHVDHWAITGDVVNFALPEEFYKIASLFKKIGHAEEISFVPGNHDFYVKSSEEICYQILRPWMQGDRKKEENRELEKRKRDMFPYLRLRSNVALIGLLSARSTSIPFLAAGYFDAKEAEKLGVLLKDAGEKGLCRVLMIHHPPIQGAVSFSKRLFGMSRFHSVIRDYGAELILHGHSHIPSCFMLDGPLGRTVPVVGVASASQIAGTKKPAAQWNFFQIEKKNEQWKIQLKRRAVTKQQKQFKEIEDVCLL